jgi:hypothetical protein
MTYPVPARGIEREKAALCGAIAPSALQATTVELIINLKTAKAVSRSR